MTDLIALSKFTVGRTSISHICTKLFEETSMGATKAWFVTKLPTTSYKNYLTNIDIAFEQTIRVLGKMNS